MLASFIKRRALLNLAVSTIATMSSPKLGTHNGTFHCDEVLACYMLRLLPEYREASVVRSRDPEVLKSCDVVVDVGGVYDPGQHRYDHHQRSFNETMSTLTDRKKPWTTKLSSAGLIYHHFGERVLSLLTGFEVGSSQLVSIYDAMYSNFLEEVDAVDNGIEDREGTPKYRIRSTLSHRVSRLNPAWNDPDQNTDTRFHNAMNIVGEEFKDIVKYYKEAWLPARSIVQSAVEKRFEIDSSGEIIVLETSCPWKEHLFMLETELSIKPSIKFVLYSETENKKWRVQAVPICDGSFVSRIPLLEKWRGLRDQELSDLSGISDCVFVHSSGFIGGNLTMTGALQMAQRTLYENRSHTNNSAS